MNLFLILSIVGLVFLVLVQASKLHKYDEGIEELLNFKNLPIEDHIYAELIKTEIGKQLNKKLIDEFEKNVKDCIPRIVNDRSYSIVNDLLDTATRDRFEKLSLEMVKKYTPEMFEAKLKESFEKRMAQDMAGNLLDMGRYGN